MGLVTELLDDGLDFAIALNDHILAHLALNLQILVLLLFLDRCLHLLALDYHFLTQLLKLSGIATLARLQLLFAFGLLLSKFFLAAQSHRLQLFL